MIQRIQSIYLLLITASLVAVLFLPLGVFTNDTGVFEFTAFSIKQSAVSGVQVGLPVWIFGGLAILSALIAFISIFMYKKRLLQIKMCIYNGILMVVLYLVYFAFIYLAKNELTAVYNFSFAVFLPFIALILDILGAKAIGKDEALVKSLDRIR